MLHKGKYRKQETGFFEKKKQEKQVDGNLTKQKAPISLAGDGGFAMVNNMIIFFHNHYSTGYIYRKPDKIIHI
ncbi:hypothetical protein HCC36_06680 [Listeria booriae]|uniref:Uncharacterized protein n=1 Tax=Listeria booriae TaxID=1552123 RepID=A0A842G315_9LIST|nr:hypothetical protein [Listeria booriae]MBC2292916.1 hypothetical protein [Listeria booriae]